MSQSALDDELRMFLQRIEARYVHPEYFARPGIPSYLGVTAGQDLRSAGTVPDRLKHHAQAPLSPEQQLSALLHMQVEMEQFRAGMIKRSLELAEQLKAAKPTCASCEGSGRIPIPASEGDRFGKATHLCCAFCGGTGTS